MKEEKRRVKAAVINPDDIAACFLNPQFRRPDKNQNRFSWRVLELLDCPPDAEVLTGGWEMVSNGIRIYIYHPSFDYIPPHEIVPLIQTKTRIIVTDTTGAIVNTIVNVSSPDGIASGESHATGPAQGWRANPLL